MRSRADSNSKSVDKVKRLISLQHLIPQFDKLAEKSVRPSKFRSVKLSQMPIKKRLDSLVNNGKKKILPGRRLLNAKAHIIRKNCDSPLAAKALHASKLCAEEQQMQVLLATLREKDFNRFLPGRCTPLRFKELMLAQRNLKNMKKTAQSNKIHSFTDLSDSKRYDHEKELNETKEKWEEIARVKEERQFRITRVIEYLKK